MFFAYDKKKEPTDNFAAWAALKARDSKLFNLWLQTVQVFPSFAKLLERYVSFNSLIRK